MSYFNPQRMPVLPDRRRKAARLQLEQIVARPTRPGGPGGPAKSYVPSGLAKPGRRVKPAVIAAALYEPVTNKSDARCFTVADTSDSAHR